MQLPALKQPQTSVVENKLLCITMLIQFIFEAIYTASMHYFHWQSVHILISRLEKQFCLIAVVQSLLNNLSSCPRFAPQTEKNLDKLPCYIQHVPSFKFLSCQLLLVDMLKWISFISVIFLYGCIYVNMTIVTLLWTA